MDKKKILLWATGSLFGIALLALLVLWIAVRVNERKAYSGGDSGGVWCLVSVANVPLAAWLWVFEQLRPC